MVAFLLLLLTLVIIAGLFYIRYLRLKFGVKDSNSGGVQHISQASPKVSSDALVLLGSRAGLEGSFLKVKKEMTLGLHIESDKRDKRKKDFGISREELKRSYMIDALLERPKF